VHRAALLADIALVSFIGIFLWRLETSVFRAFLSTALRHPLSLALTALLLAGAATFSLFIATVPGESTQRQAPASRQAANGGWSRALSALAATPDGVLLGLFPRSLVVTDADLVADREAAAGRPSVNLRGRDLRFARLDRTNLIRADLTGANLEGASLVGTDLGMASMGCADLNHVLLADGRRGTACTRASGSDFMQARLSGARMAGIDLREARLDEAQLDSAHLGHAAMSGATLVGANLDAADLSAAWLHGANLMLASLRGANLSGAKLQMADLANASLQGASLSLASLEAASLRGADLEGANLAVARLQGADLTGARLQASDLKGALVWRTKPPGGESPVLADLSQIVLVPPAEQDLNAFGAALATLENGALRARLTDGLAALSDAARSRGWGASPEQQLWLGYAKSSEAMLADGYRARLTEHLVRLMCRPHGEALAAGLVRRALAPGFKGDLPALYDRLRAPTPDCPAASSMLAGVMRDLAVAAEAARQAAPPPPQPLTQARTP
jgi:uncharacterized protein YjbI with pentapeptide repeats